MPNPQKGKIILVDHTEVSADGRGSFLKIYDMGGETYRIAEKRSNLWDYFRNARKFEPVLAIFETYNNIEYIANARPITDDILKGAIATLGEKASDKTNNERNRSTSLSYAKDLVIAGIVKLDDIFSQAQDNYSFIIGGKNGNKNGDDTLDTPEALETENPVKSD